MINSLFLNITVDYLFMVKHTHTLTHTSHKQNTDIAYVFAFDENISAAFRIEIKRFQSKPG